MVNNKYNFGNDLIFNIETINKRQKKIRKEWLLLDIQKNAFIRELKYSYGIIAGRDKNGRTTFKKI